MDTTGAYPVIPGFPMPFERLRESYVGFKPGFEVNRRSIEQDLTQIVGAKATPEQIRDAMNSADGPAWFRQRVFYRSTIAFYRSFELFCAFLSLEHACFQTWAQITAYYCRFFFLHAFLNLLQATFVYYQGYAVMFSDGHRVHYLDRRALPQMMRSAGSHEQWWYLMEAVKHPADYPIENIESVIGRLTFSPEKRNTLNYSFDYMHGFPELEWIDVDTRQMLSHFRVRPRADRDLTDIDRYFRDDDPENVDAGDFYTDDGVVLWSHLSTYLRLLKSLDIQQSIVKTEKLAVLTEIHIGRALPVAMEGMITDAMTILADDFDMNSFMRRREADPGTISSYF